MAALYQITINSHREFILSRKYLDIMVVVGLSILLLQLWMHVVGVLHAIAIPEHYVKNPDGSYHGKMWVILVWDLLVIHIPSLLMPCALFAFFARFWLVKNSKTIILIFTVVYLSYYVYSLLTQYPIMLPPSILSTIFTLIPTPYPLLGVALGAWFGSKADRRKRSEMV